MKDFFQNVSRYPRYFITFTLGVLYTAVQPLLPLFERRSTAIATSLLLLSAFAFLVFTLRAMLGLSAV
jgi:hypothetical protein